MYVIIRLMYILSFGQMKRLSFSTCLIHSMSGLVPCTVLKEHLLRDTTSNLTPILVKVY